MYACFVLMNSAAKGVMALVRDKLQLFPASVSLQVRIFNGT